MQFFSMPGLFNSFHYIQSSIASTRQGITRKKEKDNWNDYKEVKDNRHLLTLGVKSFR